MRAMARTIQRRAVVGLQSSWWHTARRLCLALQHLDNLLADFKSVDSNNKVTLSCSDSGTAYLRLEHEREKLAGRKDRGQVEV